jgi:Na+/H+ antiporter NhaD/arsenite permease-like protein
MKRITAHWSFPFIFVSTVLTTVSIVFYIGELYSAMILPVAVLIAVIILLCKEIEDENRKKILTKRASEE